jgi:hypothetical protein
MSYTELKSTSPKARKEYCCAWCNEKILKGEEHSYRAYIFDGIMQDDRMHFECASAMGKAPKDLELEEGFMPGEFKRGTFEYKYMDEWREKYGKGICLWKK